MTALVRSRPHLCALLLGCAAFLPALFTRDIWPPLEARYAQVSREMAATGQLLLPHVNGELYPDKPPLSFWLGALLDRAGLGVQGHRAGAVLCSIGAVVATSLLARLWFSARTALLAAAVLATTFEFAWVGRFGVPDPALAMLSTLAVWGWFAGGRRVLVFWVSLGLGVLAKAPVALLVPALAVLAGRLARVESRPRPRRHALWGAPLAAAVIAAWLVPALAAGGAAYADELIGHHVIGRVVRSWSHRHSFLWYVEQLPGSFFPWIFVAVPAFFLAWRKGGTARALVWWFALGFAVFSAISSKRVRYLLPLFPIVAIVVAAALDRERPSTPRDWTRRLAYVQHVALVVAGVALAGLALGAGKLFPLKPYAAEAFGHLHAAWALAGAGLAGLAVVGARTARRGAHARSVTLLVAEALVLLWIVDLALVPRMDTYRSPRRVCERIDALVPPGSPGAVAVYPRVYHGAYSLYSRRLTLTLLENTDDVLRFLRGAGRRLVLVHRDEFENERDAGGKTLAEVLAPATRRIEKTRVGRDEVLYFANFDLR